MSRRPASLLPHALRGLPLGVLLAIPLVAAASSTAAGHRSPVAETSSTYASAVLADAPSAWWRLDETGGTVAADAVGRDTGTYRYGVVEGAPSLLPGDPASHSAAFDGVDDDVAVPSSPALTPTKAVSVEAWIRADSLPALGSFASVVTKRESYSLQFNGPRLEFTIIQSGLRRRLQAPSGAIATGRVYHVVGTYGAGVQRLYIDGSEVASAPLSGAITSNSNPLTIGSWGGTQERFDGGIDEPAVYDAVLSAAEVAAHDSAGRGVPAPTATASPVPASSSSPAPVPTASAAPTPTSSSTTSPTPTPVPASSPSASPTAGTTPAPTLTPTATATAAPTPTTAPTLTPAPTAKPAPTATPAPTPSPTPTATPAPTPAPAASALRTGMALHFMWQSLSATNADLDRMKAAGMTYARFDVSWRNMEPSKGTYQYLDKLDQIIAAVQAHGMSLTMTVIETPAWANNSAGMFAPPSNMADYASFVGMLARRYAAKSGMVWEVWNEENDPHFWTTGPSAAQYTSMLKAAYSAIKAGDPDATVLVGGVLFNNIAFLDGIYAAGGGGSFDGIAIHPYTVNRAPSDTSSAYYSFASSVPQFQRDMASHGQSKPIWVTEFGWSTDSVSDATRATWYTSAVAIARTWTGVRAIGAYTMHQSQFLQYGLLTSTGAATLSWNAYVAAQ